MTVTTVFIFRLPHHAPTRSTLFPYTTLFRSHSVAGAALYRPDRGRHPRAGRRGGVRRVAAQQLRRRRQRERCALVELGRRRERSEEHTSELQSLTNLVCRLLLEKKKLQPTQG